MTREEVNWSEAGKKAAETRKRNEELGITSTAATKPERYVGVPTVITINGIAVDLTSLNDQTLKSLSLSSGSIVWDRDHKPLSPMEKIEQAEKRAAGRFSAQKSALLASQQAEKEETKE